ncbi:hypothetical protein [Mesorhizobium sp.]|uniref:hypothetical protein n=1 Tax=Mesorhizobium sp. TaxID=1871066 RepID=UPI0025F73F51|nr:hypothetical protein [Mesorhizobium sp.]
MWTARGKDYKAIGLILGISHHKAYPQIRPLQGRLHDHRPAGGKGAFAALRPPPHKTRVSAKAAFHHQLV